MMNIMVVSENEITLEVIFSSDVEFLLQAGTLTFLASAALVALAVRLGNLNLLVLIAEGGTDVKVLTYPFLEFRSLKINLL